MSIWKTKNNLEMLPLTATPNLGRTVLILGAGASAELGLPIGETLKSQIAGVLQVSTDDFGRFRAHDQVMAGCFQQLAQQHFQNHYEPLRVAAEHIVAALPLAQSIDNLLHQRRDDERIAMLGKLAIALCILRAESKCKLAPQRTNGQESVVSAANTWYGEFFKRLTEGCGRDELASRFSKLAVISFNYDRCFEQFMVLAVKQFYALSLEASIQIVRSIEVLHPYGQVGNYPSLQRTHHEMDIPFGLDISSSALIQLSREVRTFTEATDTNSETYQRIRSVIGDAGRVFYLGFAYYRQNMELLYGDSQGRPSAASQRPCLGTAYGISRQDRDAVNEELQRYEGHPLCELQDAKCVDLLNQNSRQFTFT